MNNEVKTCIQPIDEKGMLCGKLACYQFSKARREMGLPATQYPYCSAHKRLVRLYGKESLEAMRPIYKFVSTTGKEAPRG